MKTMEMGDKKGVAQLIETGCESKRINDKPVIDMVSLDLKEQNDKSSISNSRWEEHPLLAIFFDLPIIYKILLGNLFVVTVGAFGIVLLLAGHETSWLLGKGLPGTVLVFGGTFFLAIVINFILLRIALSPIASLKTTVEAVLHGNFHARASVPLFGDPEVNLLTDAFNRMLDKIEVYTHTIEKERSHSAKLAGLVLSSQEDERKRIAKELHDETSQILATLMMGLEAVQRSIPKNGSSISEQCVKCRTRVERLMHIADQTLGDVHRLAFNLRPAILDDMGLVQTVQWLLREHLEKGGVKVELLIEGLEQRLCPEIEVAAFRIIQEAVTNIVKYAKASKVRVSISVEDGNLYLTVEDNGIGFSLDEVEKREKDRHLGLFGMQERSHLLSGQFKIRSAPGSGTIVSAMLPINT